MEALTTLGVLAISAGFLLMVLKWCKYRISIVIESGDWGEWKDEGDGDVPAEPEPEAFGNGRWN